MPFLATHADRDQHRLIITAALEDPQIGALTVRQYVVGEGEGDRATDAEADHGLLRLEVPSTVGGAQCVPGVEVLLARATAIDHWVKADNLVGEALSAQADIRAIVDRRISRRLAHRLRCGRCNAGRTDRERQPCQRV